MLILDPPFPFVSGAYRIKLAEAPWERRECARLRREVFCVEQGLFERDDADAIDGHAWPIAALRCVAAMPDGVVGTVRVHEIEPGLWQGSRLAVASECRKVAGLGTELIRYAVSFARSRGARRFIAQVQSQNVPLFLRLHWRALGEVELMGRPHRYMEADLTHYPLLARPEVDLVVPAVRAA